MIQYPLAVHTSQLGAYWMPAGAGMTVFGDGAKTLIEVR
jgi:hypothetical protein